MLLPGRGVTAACVRVVPGSSLELAESLVSPDGPGNETNGLVVLHEHQGDDKFGCGGGTWLIPLSYPMGDILNPTCTKNKKN